MEKRFYNGYIAETEREALWSEYSDLHKDVYGCRPKHGADCSANKLTQMIRELEDEADAWREHEDACAEDWYDETPDEIPRHEELAEMWEDK